MSRDLAPLPPLVPTVSASDVDGRALSVGQVRQVAILEPLKLNDPRYAELNEGFRPRELAKLRWELAQAAATGNDRAAKMLLVGHKGSGKTTELYRIEDELSKDYFPIHVFMDESLESDCDYSLLMLQMCDQLWRTFADRGLPLNAELVEAVGAWFASRVVTDVNKYEEDYRAEVQAKAKAGGSILAFGAWIVGIGRIQAASNTQQRVEIVNRLRQRPEELVRHVNLLLDEARRALERAGLPGRILIVHDNYDRLKREPAREMFFRHGDLLRQIDAACIFTAPVTAKVAPYDMKLALDNCFILHTVKLKAPDGTRHEPGIAALRALLAARVDLDRVFATPTEVETLVMASGGSLRDLVRMLGWAARNAQVDGKERIDAAAVTEAVADIRNAYARSFFLGNKYYPRLAAIHRSKKASYTISDSVDEKQTDEERKFFEDLLNIGAVLEYNGDRSWFDVHPTIQDIPDFQDALRKLDAATSSPPAAPA